MSSETPVRLRFAVKDADLYSILTEHMLWSGFNFVHPEVRQHRLDFIERTAAAHDFDGYELDFNRSFNYANEPTQELSREEFVSALSELGEAETLAGRNKVYGIHSTAHPGGPIIQGSESALLPVVLDRVETKLPLLMGPDGDDENARFRISLWTAESREDTQIWVRLNHTLLSAPVREEPWYHVDVPAGIMRSGANELGIISDTPAGGPFPGIVAPPGVKRKDWLGWKRNEGTLVDEFAEGRLVRDADTKRRREMTERRPVIVHQIFVTVEYPDR